MSAKSQSDDAPAVRVWTELTEIEGRPERQEGELRLGNAIVIDGSTDTAAKSVEAFRDASTNDIVLHILRDKGQLVAISIIDSQPTKLDEEVDSSDGDQDTPEQVVRYLRSFEKLDSSIDLDAFLSTDAYADELHSILGDDRELCYTEDLTLDEDATFTRVPPDLLELFVRTSSDLARKLAGRGYPVEALGASVLPASDYQGVTNAVQDVRSRLADRPGERNRLGEQLPETIIQDWTESLSNLQSGSVISPVRDVRIQQLRSLFERIEPQLREQAERIGSGTIEDLTPAETLFLALLRDLQEEIGLTPNVNQERIKVALTTAYSVHEPGKEHETELPRWARDADGSVHMLTASLEYWIAVIQRRALLFSADEEYEWGQCNEGDIVLFRTTGESDLDENGGYHGGIVGVGVVRTRTNVAEAFWSDEDRKDLAHPNLVTFSRLLVTGDYVSQSSASPIAEASLVFNESDFEALLVDNLPNDQVGHICRQETGRSLSNEDLLETIASSKERGPAPRILKELVPKLHEISPLALKERFVGEIPASIFDDLYFPDHRPEELADEIGAALRAGNHIIFTGPPGTGKTEVAKLLTEYLATAFPWLYSGSEITTATADWSTFDTVGGYMPEVSSEDGQNEQLTFSPGVVLNRLKDSRSGTQRNEPLVIDEINRADIDKAFGQLFTTLSGQSVQLPYKRNGCEVELHTADTFNAKPAAHQYIVPDSWRLFATMNSYDKTSLYEMSYAFMRRFALIRIGAPELPQEEDALIEFVQQYVEHWDDVDASPRECKVVGTVWSAVNAAEGGRELGPAIVHDMLAYLGNHKSLSLEERLTKAVISYVFPQLEGVPKRKQILMALTKVSAIEADELERAAEEILDVSSLRYDE